MRATRGRYVSQQHTLARLAKVPLLAVDETRSENWGLQVEPRPRLVRRSLHYVVLGPVLLTIALLEQVVVNTVHQGFPACVDDVGAHADGTPGFNTIGADD